MGACSIRTQRRVELTEAGAAFRSGAREVLDKMQASLQITRDLLRGESRRLRLGLTPGAGLLPFLATTIQRFHIAHPDIRLTLHELPTNEYSRTLQTRELDACVIRLPLTGPPPLRDSIKLLHDRLVVAMHRDHPLRHRAALTVVDLVDEPFIIHPEIARRTGLARDHRVNCAPKDPFRLESPRRQRTTSRSSVFAPRRQGVGSCRRASRGSTCLTSLRATRR